MNKSICILFLSALGLCGCVSGPQAGFVAREWGRNMRELGIYPLFPPREDVQVGDLYVLAPDTKGPDKSKGSPTQLDYVGIGVFLSSLDVRTDVSAHLKTRLELSKTTTAFPKGSPSDLPLAPQPAYDDSTDAFERQRLVNRLPLVGMPEFVRARYTGADAQALIPTEALQAGVGFAASDVESATVSVPVGEYVEVPAPLVVSKMLTPDNACKSKRKLDFADSLGPYLQGNVDREAVTIAVVTGVYYARAIDTQLSFTRSFAGTLQGKLSAELVGKLIDQSRADVPSDVGKQASSQGQAAAATAQGNQAPQGGHAEDEAVNPTVEAQAAAAQQDLQAKTSSTGPGVSTSLVSVSAGGIGLRRTFERPLAIGWRGVFLEIAVKDLCATSAAPVNSALPTFAPK